MGSLISAPISAAGTCLGGCFGSCLATGCCKLAGSGNVSSAQAARFVLIWLQVFTTALALLLAATADQWLPWTCDKLDTVGLGELGICSCRSDTGAKCWSDQLIYRAEAAGAIVFAALFFMSLSGCAEGAAKSYSVAKFMGVVLLVFVSLFVSNQVWLAFGGIATAASAIFLVAQAVLLIDFGYTWGETWWANAQQAQSREFSQCGFRMWTGALLLGSLALVLGAITVSVYLYKVYQDGSGRTVDLSATILSSLLLVVSIPLWSERGYTRGRPSVDFHLERSLVPSSVMMAYTMWLVCEALAVSPTGKTLDLPIWAGLTLCSLSLLSAAVGMGGLSGTEASTSSSEVQMEHAERGPEGLMAAAAEAGQAPAAVSEASSGSMSKSEVWMFAGQCAVHLSATLYVASSLAPRTGSTTYAFRVTAVFLSLALYGWSLVAPKVLTGRRFQ